jgi:hypothetical protein
MASVFGIAVPSELFLEMADERFVSLFCARVRERRPALVTSATDIPSGADLKQVARVLKSLREACAGADPESGRGG